MNATFPPELYYRLSPKAAISYNRDSKIPSSAKHPADPQPCRPLPSNFLFGKNPFATTSTMTPPRSGRRDGVVAAHGLGYAYAKRAKRAARARSISSWEARGGGDFGVNLKLLGLEKYPVVGGRRWT
mmetsp:Transcript_16504/g.56905  ORF Transcript_16504/g.56905 Transcript_16504/m.56905 type:complete len:127 (-) Transcript_16504:1070-1450(-)